MPYKRIKGLSFLELTTTMAITGIVFGIAIPSLGNLIKENRLATHINTLRSSLSLTRSIAVEQNVYSVICKSSDGENCSREGNWNDGWIVFADKDNNRKISGKENPVLVQGPLPETTSVTYRAFGSKNYIAYRPTGLTRTNGTFVLCNPDSPNRAKTLILNKSGRIRLSKTMPGGKEIKCKKTSK